MSEFSNPTRDWFLAHEFTLLKSRRRWFNKRFRLMFHIPTKTWRYDGELIEPETISEFF